MHTDVKVLLPSPSPSPSPSPNPNPGETLARQIEASAVLGPFKDEAFGLAAFGGCFAILERPCAPRCGGFAFASARARRLRCFESIRSSSKRSKRSRRSFARSGGTTSTLLGKRGGPRAASHSTRRRLTAAAAAMSDCAFAARSAPRTRSKLASMSPKHSATSIRSTIDCAMRSTESPPRSTASLRDEAVEHRADRIEVDEHSLVDPFEVPEARSDIETRFRLFRRAERDLVERLSVAASRVTAFGDVERDARHRPPHLSCEIDVGSRDRVDDWPKRSNQLK